MGIEINGQHETTIAITLHGVTRTVEISYLTLEGGERGGSTAPGAAAVIGRGKAVYPAGVALHPVADAASAHRNNQVATAADGTVWQYHYGTSVRNRQAQIVGWDSVAPLTNDVTQTRL